MSILLTGISHVGRLVGASLVLTFANASQGETRQAGPASWVAQDQAETDPPVYLRDRGTGVATSMFGTYVRRRELLLYPFVEYYHDDNLEYSPQELGGGPDVDFRGRYRATEGLLFVAYGLSDHLAVEMEAAVIAASLDKAPEDGSALPLRLEESGLGDIEAQLRWRWKTETASGPELFTYSEVVFPHSGDKVLIGTPGWELKLGTGLTRGRSWGTVTIRGAIEYSEESTSHFDLGEYAVEYLKRLSPSWRIYLAVEGTQDELSLITEAQWHVRRNMFIRFNNGVGITSKATDWAPELGILIALPVR
jgi:hypothetical protein